MSAARTHAREAKRAMSDVIGTRAGFKTLRAVHSQHVSELERRARAFDEIEKAARQDDLNGNDLAEVVYQVVGRTTGREIA